MSSTSHRQEKAVHYRPPTPDTIDDFAQDVCTVVGKRSLASKLSVLVGLVAKIEDRHHNQQEPKHE